MFLLSIFVYAESKVNQKTEWKGKIIKDGDVTVVKNPKEPIYRSNILSFKEEWVLGGAKAKPESTFSQVRHIVVDELENIYVLDFKESNIRVFDKAGRYLRTIGRAGQGPQELSSPLRLSINKTKKELMVSQVPRRVTFFGLDGEFLRVLNTGARWTPQAEIDSFGNMVGMEAIVGPPESWFVLNKYDGAMNLIAELAKKPAPNPMAFNPFAPIPVWDLDDHDNIIFGYPEKYEILLINPQNKIKKVIMKDYDPVEVESSEMEEYKKSDLPGVKYDFSKSHSAFQNFAVDDLGRLFVRTWSPAPNKVDFLYDLFDGEGRYLATMPIKGRLMVVKKGKIYSLEEDEEGYHVVRCYKATWKF